MITALAHVKKNLNGWTMFLNKKLMLNGCQLIQNFVHGVKKLFKEVLDATLWLVYVEKTFVTCVQNHGNQIIRIISNVIFIKRVQQNK